MCHLTSFNLNLSSRITHQSRRQFRAVLVVHAVVVGVVGVVPELFGHVNTPHRPNVRQLLQAQAKVVLVLERKTPAFFSVAVVRACRCSSGAVMSPMFRCSSSQNADSDCEESLCRDRGSAAASAAKRTRRLIAGVAGALDCGDANAEVKSATICPTAPRASGPACLADCPYCEPSCLV